MRRRLKFKPPEEILTRIKDILYNALWENKDVWEDFYNRYGWKLKRIKRASYPCDWQTIDLGGLYDITALIFIPPQTEAFQAIQFIIVKTKYEPLTQYWQLSFSVMKKKPKATETSKKSKKGRSSELGKVIPRISLFFRHYIRGKPHYEEWYRHAIEYFNFWLHKYNVKKYLNPWQWLIKKSFNYYLHSSFKRSVLPETNWRGARPAEFFVELDLETPELYLVLMNEETAKESLYKIRAVHCRCPYFMRNPRKAKILTSHDGQNGLKIPIFRALMARYKQIRTGGIMLYVEKVWKRSGAYNITPFWLEDEVIKKLMSVKRFYSPIVF